jgi:hypothetical protein
MLLNYFKIALRNLSRHKGYAAINITGLAIGIAASLLLFLVIRYELSYDRFQPNFDQIYHVVTSEKTPEDDNINPGVPVPALEVFRLKFPQAKVAGIFSSYGSQFTIMGNDSTSAHIKGKYLEETVSFLQSPNSLKYLYLPGSMDHLPFSLNPMLLFCRNLLLKNILATGSKPAGSSLKLIIMPPSWLKVLLITHHLTVIFPLV